jgi:ATP-dependent Clp protease, protease subunit
MRWLTLIPIASLLVCGCHTTRIPERHADHPQHLSAKVDFDDALLNQRKVLLIGPLNDAAAEVAIQKLLYLDGRSPAPIDLYLQTPGGQFKAAMAIEQVMRSLRAKVNTYALSECNSGGALLLAAGTGKRRAFRGGLIVVHAIKVVRQPPEDFTQGIQKAHDDFWRAHAKLPEEWLPLKEGNEYVLTADEALKYGVVDEIVE